MPISEFLLPELDEEIKKTRTTLERVPADKKITHRIPSRCRWASWRPT
jgi:hypothetical protein